MVGAKTDFVFLRTKDWRKIDKKMKALKCLRCGVTKVEKDGVVILCAKTS